MSSGRRAEIEALRWQTLKRDGIATLAFFGLALALLLTRPRPWQADYHPRREVWFDLLYALGAIYAVLVMASTRHFKKPVASLPPE